MPTIYITASNRWTALFWKEYLQRHGHVVTSDWHEQNLTPTAQMSDLDKGLTAALQHAKLSDSDILLIVADRDIVPGAKFVHAGLALGLSKKVILVGRRENLAMHDARIIQCTEPWEVLRNCRND